MISFATSKTSGGKSDRRRRLGPPDRHQPARRIGTRRRVGRDPCRRGAGDQRRHRQRIASRGAPGAWSGDVNIAYRVAGDGPFDVVFVPGTTSNVELAWEVPFLRALFERIASFARLIVFDKRGTGMSDAADAGTPLEVRMDDVRAVMDAVGSQRAPALR